MKSSLGVAFLALFLFVLPLSAQTVDDAAAHFNKYIRFVNNGVESTAYSELYESFQAYVHVLANSPSGSAACAESKKALAEIFPLLQNAAYYYTRQNNEQKTFQFAQAHVGLAMLPAMQDMNLQRNSNFAILAKLVAIRTWNQNEHAQSIPYWQAYISTGDEDRREQAYACVGQAYYEAKDYAQAKTYLRAGLRMYPSSLPMLSMMINSCIDSEDTGDLQPYLTKALSLRPNDEGLLNTQGLLFETNHQFEEAVGIYSRLRQRKPQSLDVARHLALNNYNAGVQYLIEAQDGNSNSSKAPDKKRFKVRLIGTAFQGSKSKSQKNKAMEYFRAAAPILDQIVVSDPSRASVKYAVALANVYSFLNEAEKLSTMNRQLASWGYATVSDPELALIGVNDPNPQYAKSTSSDVASLPTLTPVTSAPVTPASGRTSVASTPVAKSATKASSLSDVDIDIPVNPTKNDKTYAVIIANEKYTKVPEVAMARHDGEVFAKYCNKTLGIPNENISSWYDCTWGDIDEALENIKAIARACKGDLNVLFYYSGHGMPDESTKDAFLLPVDANGHRTRGCLSLKELYNHLASLNANNVCVFMDACFSGATRDGNVLNPDARGTVIEPAPVEAKGNLIVFSAATGKQTAMPYKEKQHGLFTYYLLKKLQMSKGSVTLNELKQYLDENVPLRSLKINRKEQTPTVTIAPELEARWKNIRLNR